MGTVSITQLTNGTTADATAVDNNFNAIANQLNGNVDSTNLAANAITDSQLATSVSPVTFRKEAFANFVASGLTIATSASLTSTILAGTAYVNGKRVTLSNTPITVTASKDTYVDLKDDGSIVQVAVANGATSGMPLTTNSDSTNALRIAKLVSSGTAITNSTQTGVDSLNNQVYPTSAVGLNAWLTYTPSWTSTGTAPGVGNGTLTGTYIQLGKTVICRVELTIGSTTAGGTGEWSFSVPVNIVANRGFAGSAWGIRSGVSYEIGAVANRSGNATLYNSKFTPYSHGGSAGWGPSIPVTWATSDVLLFELTYEAA